MTKEPSSTTLTRVPKRARPRGGPPTPGRAVPGGTNSGDPTPPGPDRSGNQPVGRDRPAGGVPPLSVDSFLGRDDDMRGIEDLFERGRLVTITGAPGMGKTRLATELARSASKDRYPDGRWLVPLAPVASFELVAPALAKAMGVPEQGQADIVAGLVRHIGDAHLLIVLDNCEHQLDACARLAADLVESCPNLRILATSQERLGVPGEQIWPLSGLAAPDLRAAEIDEATATTAATFPAVALFAERARAVRPGFTVETADVDIASVAEICRRLDGIPLAIELAAALVDTFSPTEIAARLDDRFALLTAGARTARPRHQTLRAAVDWSYELLADEQQAALRRLSVFAGGATLDAIEEVCVGECVDADACASLVARLVARSLVVADHSGATTRYRLLETIRVYGQDRLVEAGEAGTTASRHLRWCVELAEAAEPQLSGPDQDAWLARLDIEHDNLRAAMARSLDHGPTDQALRLVGAQALFWRARGHFGEGLGWADRALTLNEGADQLLLAKAYWSKAMMAAMLGRWTEVLVAARSSLERCPTETQQGASVAGRALLLLAGTPIRNRSVNEELAACQRSIAMARQAGDSWCLAHGLAQCGTTLVANGDGEAGRLMLEEAVSVSRAAGDNHALVYAVISQGLAGLQLGDLELGESSFREGVALTTMGNSDPGGGADVYERLVAMTGLAEVATARGRLVEAGALLHEIERLPRSAAIEAQIKLLEVAAQLALAAGDLDGATRSLAALTGIAAAAGVGFGVSPLLLLAELALHRADSGEARSRLAQVADELETTSTGPRLKARARYLSAEVERALDGDIAQAAVLHHEALVQRLGVGDLAGVAQSLEACAGMAARAERPTPGAVALGVASTLRDEQGYGRTWREQAVFDWSVESLRAEMGVEEFATAFETGRTTSPEAAVAALSRRRGSQVARPEAGVASLTDAERKVARLAADGLTNPEIAARLFVSVHTVKAHLTKVFAKLSASSRSELISRFPPGRL